MKPCADRQTARSSIRVGRRVKITTQVDVTAVGLLSIAGLVSSILLSTAVLVAATIRARQGR